MHFQRMVFVGALFLSAVPIRSARAEEPKELTDPFYAMSNPKKTLRGAQLTNAQFKEILDYRNANTWEREKQTKKERDDVWHQFDELYLAPGPLDETKLLVLAKRATQLEAEVEVLKARVMFKMREVLTPEQLQRVIDIQRRTKEINNRRDALEAEKKAFAPTIASELNE